MNHVPVFAFPAEAGPYLPTGEGRKAELDDVHKNNAANGCEAAFRATDRQLASCEIRRLNWEGGGSKGTPTHIQCPFGPLLDYMAIGKRD